MLGVCRGTSRKHDKHQNIAIPHENSNIPAYLLLVELVNNIERFLHPYNRNTENTEIHSLDTTKTPKFSRLLTP